MRPKFFIGRAAIETAALSVLRGDLPIIHTVAPDADVWRGQFEVVFDGELDKNSETEWFMTANQNIVDTVTVFFLNGVDAPIMTEMDSTIGAPLGKSWQLIIDVAVKAIDHRGVFKNAGA